MEKSCNKCSLVKVCAINGTARGLIYERGVSHQHSGIAANEFERELKIVIAEHCSFYKEDK